MSTLAIESRTLAIARSAFKSPVLPLVTLGLFLAHSAGCRHSDQSGKSADLKSEQGKTAGITIIHPERRDIRMNGRSTGDDRGLRDDADLFEDRRVCPGVPVQHWRPRQGWRCPH